MSKPTVEQHNTFNIYTTKIGDDQIFISACILPNTHELAVTTEQMFNRIAEIISLTEFEIVQERYFGVSKLQSQIMNIRESTYQKNNIKIDWPATWVEGKPAWGTGFAGIQIRGVKPLSSQDRVWTIYEEERPAGRGWTLNGTTHLFLQNMHGFQNGPTMITDNSQASQTKRMFERSERLLQCQGADYRNVVRTWIYLDNILDWYDEFNAVRNQKYKEYKIISGNSVLAPDYEGIPLPASTGIRAKNPINASGVMDVLAVIPSPDAKVEIQQTAGVKQRSPYRYGSAFSRAMSVREQERTSIYVSGTAAIDEKGVSLYPNDTRSQIIKTLEIVDALISNEGASLQNICEATAFLKNPEDFQVYHDTIAELGLESLPAVCVLADVCRDDLLFEIDAMVLV